MLNSTYLPSLAVSLVCAILLPSPHTANAQGGADAIHPIVGKWQYVGGSAGKVKSEKPIRLTFRYMPATKQSDVLGQGGCNNVSRRFKIIGSDVVLEGAMFATRRYCGGPPRDTEAIVKRLLGHDTGWSVEGASLILYDISGKPFAKFKKIVQ